MTEKRLFGAVKGHYREHIVDNTGRLYSDGEVADLLNEQHEQINTLRESRRELISANNEYRMRETELAQELSTLVDENEQLKNIILFSYTLLSKNTIDDDEYFEFYELCENIVPQLKGDWE